MGIIHLYEIEQWNFLQLFEVGQGGYPEGELMGVIKPMYNVSLFRIITMNLPKQQIYPN
jgi:hypothetical protein